MEFRIRADEHEVETEVVNFLEQAMDALTTSRPDFVVTYFFETSGGLYDVSKRAVEVEP